MSFAVGVLSIIAAEGLSYVSSVAVVASPLVTFFCGYMLVKEAHSTDRSLNLSSDNDDIIVAENIRLSRLGRQLGAIIVSQGIVMFTSLFGIFMGPYSYVYVYVAAIVSFCIYISASVFLCRACSSCCRSCCCCCDSTGIKSSTSTNCFKGCLLYNIASALYTPAVVFRIPWILDLTECNYVYESVCRRTAIGVVSTISALGLLSVAIGVFIIFKWKRVFRHRISIVEHQMSQLELQTRTENYNSESLLQDTDDNSNNSNNNSQNNNDDMSLTNTSTVMGHPVVNVIV